MTYIMPEKNPTPYYVRERISNSRGLGKTFSPKLNHPYLSLLYKSQMVSHIGGGEEADLCHPSTKWLARVHHVVVFKTKVLHFKIENRPIKDTYRKRTFKRMLRFLFVDKLEIVFWGIQPSSTWFSLRRIRALGLFWTNRGSEVSEETWGKFCTLFGQGSRSCAFEIDFFWHVLSRQNLRQRIQDPVSIIRKLLFRIKLISVFEKKISRN